MSLTRLSSPWLVVLSLGVVGLTAAAAWPLVARWATVAEVTAAVVAGASGPEVVVHGRVDDPTVPPLGIQQVTVEKPGTPPFKRPVALSTERTFDLVLGPPVPGRYAVTVHWHRQPLWGQPQPTDLVVPLMVASAAAGPQARVRAYDVRAVGLYGLAIAAAVVGTALGLHRAVRSSTAEKDASA